MTTHEFTHAPSKSGFSFLSIALFWTVVIGTLSGWHYYQDGQAALENARTAARHSFGKDLTFRRWATSHGGVYVPTTAATPPNPYLAHVAERDITTPAGRPLTLVNPAYMMRQFHEMADELFGTRGHITSLQPLRPENGPDAWEVAGLHAFTRGDDEWSSMLSMDGQPYFRLMRPLLAEQGCLKCHAAQGYQVGDILGGISVAVPWTPYRQALLATLPGYFFGYGGLWLAGLFFIELSRRRLGEHLQERRRTEDALRRERQRLENIIEGTRAGTWEWEVQTGKTVFNDRWAEMIGYRLEELEPISIDTWTRLAHPDDLQVSGELLARHFAREIDYYRFEGRMRHQDGSWIWVLDRGRVVEWGADGQPLLMAGTHQDITESKEAEQAVSELLQRLQKLASHLPGMIYQFRRWPDGRSCFPYSSEGIEAVYGVRPEEVAIDATPVLQYLHPEDQPRVAAVIEKSAETLSQWRDQYRVNHPSGATLWVEGQATPELLADGSVIWHGYIADITKRKALDEAIKEHALALEERGAELERFNYTVSHDLKSPLVTVKAFLGFLEQDLATGNAERIAKDIDYMRTAANRMGQLLDELLEMSRIGRVVNPPEAVTFSELVRQSLALLAGPLAESGASIVVEPADVTLVGDRLRLLEIWQNLVENAIKYRGAQAQPRIDIGLVTEGDAPVFFVRDNGLGIDPRYCEKVFGLFEKLDSQSEGSGLGLALVKRIVELNGGRIWVVSAGIGQGCCFNFTLPAALADGEGA